MSLNENEMIQTWELNEHYIIYKVQKVEGIPQSAQVHLFDSDGLSKKAESFSYKGQDRDKVDWAIAYTIKSFVKLINNNEVPDYFFNDNLIFHGEEPDMEERFVIRYRYEGNQEVCLLLDNQTGNVLFESRDADQVCVYRDSIL